MSTNQDIIGIVRELHERRGKGFRSFRDSEWWDEDAAEAFPAIAQALLDMDAKLKIAVDALEKAGMCRHPYPEGFCHCDYKNAKKALSRIRSLSSK